MSGGGGNAQRGASESVLVIPVVSVDVRASGEQLTDIFNIAGCCCLN